MGRLKEYLDHNPGLKDKVTTFIIIQFVSLGAFLTIGVLPLLRLERNTFSAFY